MEWYIAHAADPSGGFDWNVAAVIVASLALIATISNSVVSNAATWRRLAYQQRHQCYAEVLAWAGQLPDMEYQRKINGDCIPLTPLDSQTRGSLPLVAPTNILELVEELHGKMRHDWNSVWAKRGKIENVADMSESAVVLHHALDLGSKLSLAIFADYSEHPRKPFKPELDVAARFAYGDEAT